MSCVSEAPRRKPCKITGWHFYRRMEDGTCIVFSLFLSAAHPTKRSFLSPQPNEMNPKLLLSYACERTVLPGGARMFKHFTTSLESQHLFVYIFWFVHCKFFQV